jgi:hypothetical protein
LNICHKADTQGGGALINGEPGVASYAQIFNSWHLEHRDDDDRKDDDSQ